MWEMFLYKKVLDMNIETKLDRAITKVRMHTIECNECQYTRGVHIAKCNTGHRLHKAFRKVVEAMQVRSKNGSCRNKKI